MAVTAAMVKNLREISGAGMSACKEALVEANGDIERAQDILREKGLAAAAKKAGRVAAEGVVFAKLDEIKGVLLEVNSETDFVAKNSEFTDFVSELAEVALNNLYGSVEDLLDGNAKTGAKVKDALSEKIALIGENINIRRLRLMTCELGEELFSYIHGNGRVGVILKLKCDVVNEAVREAGKNLCMQIAAMSPKYVARADIPQSFIDSEREIFVQLAINEGRDPKIAEKVVAGRLEKHLKSLCLLEQEYVKEDKLTCAAYLKNIGGVSAVDFARYETGEGIEKKVEDFAEEVNKVIKG